MNIGDKPMSHDTEYIIATIYTLIKPTRKSNIKYTGKEMSPTETSFN